jgi:CMP-N-acetylneuraminic acid synthetase
MAEFEQPIGIIPARGGSKRFPRKNIALLRNKPLLSYAIESALDSRIFSKVCVSSEDDEILETASKHGDVLALKRPEALASDTTPLKEVCAHLLNHFEKQGESYREFGLLLPTNPLRTAENIREAYKKFKDSKANFCMSLVRFSHPPQRAVHIRSGYVKPFWGLEFMTQTQKLEPLYRHDGSIIFAETKAFMDSKEYYGEKVVPFFVPEDRSVDIDSPMDLAWAEFVLQEADRQEKSRID